MNRYFHFTPAELTAVLLSVKVAVWCSVLSLPAALVIGYFMARHRFHGKSAVESLLHLPMVMPPVTTGYLLLLLFGVRGFFGKWLLHAFGIRLSFTFAAAVIASIVVSFPLFVRSVRTAMEMVDRGIEDASRILGAGRLKTFFRVTVPLSLPGIVSGFVLVFARSLGEFGATITFAGNIEGATRTLPLAIYAYMQVPGREGATLHLALVSVAISFAAMIISEWLVRNMRRQ